jgi:hypothetical protein
MDAQARAFRANAVINDEILVLAIDETLASINKSLLAAKTAEERDERWHEYHGLKRAWNLLRRWPGEAETNK